MNDKVNNEKLLDIYVYFGINDVLIENNQVNDKVEKKKRKL